MCLGELSACCSVLPTISPVCWGVWSCSNVGVFDGAWRFYTWVSRGSNLAPEVACVWQALSTWGLSMIGFWDVVVQDGPFLSSTTKLDCKVDKLSVLKTFWNLFFLKLRVPKTSKLKSFLFLAKHSWCVSLFTKDGALIVDIWYTLKKTEL